MARIRILVALVAGLAIAGIGAVPASAEPPPEALDYAITMEVAGQYGWADSNHNDTELDDKSYPGIEGAARASIPFLDNFAAQVDIGGLANFTSRVENGENNLQTDFHGGLHLNYRDIDCFSAGVFTSIGSVNGGDDENATYYSVGGETQFYLGNTTLYSQWGYFNADDEDEDDVMSNGWLVRQQIRHFFTNRDRVQVGFQFMEGNERASNVEYDAWGWETRYDHQFDGTPITAFLGYKGAKVSEYDPVLGARDEDVTEHIAFVGIGFVFGFNGTLDLLGNDRRGATYSLPDVARPAGWTIEIID